MMANIFFKGGFKFKLGRSRMIVYLYFFDISSPVNIDGGIGTTGTLTRYV